MSRVNSDGDHLRFYIAIQWTQPELHGQETDGALCLVFYKIKNSTRTDYDRIKQQTQSDPEWTEIQYSEDAWNNRGIFYIPVTDGHEVKDALQTLQHHFFSFSEEFGSIDDLD